MTFYDRVFCDYLSSDICWYAVNSKVSQENQSRLFDATVLKVLPSDLETIREVEFKHLIDKDGEPIDKKVFEKTYTPSKVKVVSNFGLLCSLLRQRKVSGHEPVLLNKSFKSAIQQLNLVDLSSLSPAEINSDISSHTDSGFGFSSTSPTNCNLSSSSHNNHCEASDKSTPSS